MLLPHDPKEIEGIQILDRLGSGGAGIVYKGRDKDNQIVALKVLHAEFANNQTVRKRLEREADAMRSVKGNRTVKVRRIEIDVVQPFIVMDFAEGENLANYIANNGVLKGQALNDFALQLAEAIRDIHKAKVIHRDLKPTNVIIGPDGLKVVDFGISIVSEVTGMTQTGILSGTASWLSPEQILGKDITEKTDIFNYGLVLGFAATGKHLFGEGKPEAVMFRILNTEPELNLFSRKMQTIIKDLISKEPSKRPDTLKNLTIIKAKLIGTNNINSDISSDVINLNKKYLYKSPIAMSILVTTLLIFLLGFYFNPFKDIVKVTTNLSANKENEVIKDVGTLNTESQNIPRTIPSPNETQSQPTTTPSVFVNELDDTKIAGNIILTTMPRRTYSYFKYGKNIIFYKQQNKEYNRVRTPYERFDYEGEWATGTPGTPLWNNGIISEEIKKNINNLISVDIDKGNGWERIKSEVIYTGDPVGAIIDLVDFEGIFLKEYKQINKISVRFNISYEFGLKEDMLYFKNGDIHLHEIIPGTCKFLYNFETNPPDNFKSKDKNNLDSDKNRYRYKIFKEKC
jgi:serine/threonine protein kinase